jgi:hypothetical protein
MANASLDCVTRLSIYCSYPSALLAAVSAAVASVIAEFFAVVASPARPAAVASFATASS